MRRTRKNRRAAAITTIAAICQVSGDSIGSRPVHVSVVGASFIIECFIILYSPSFLPEGGVPECVMREQK